MGLQEYLTVVWDLPEAMNDRKGRCPAPSSHTLILRWKVGNAYNLIKVRGHVERLVVVAGIVDEPADDLVVGAGADLSDTSVSVSSRIYQRCELTVVKGESSTVGESDCRVASRDGLKVAVGENIVEAVVRSEGLTEGIIKPHVRPAKEVPSA